MRRTLLALLTLAAVAGSFVAGARWGEPKLFGAQRARKFSVAYGRGLERGTDAGYVAGRDEGYDDGRKAGKAQGYKEGFVAGLDATAPIIDRLENAAQDSPGCHPFYVGRCLNPNSADYDCRFGDGDGPDYTGEVEIVGPDVYGLDEDDDNIGCDGQ